MQNIKGWMLMQGFNELGVIYHEMIKGQDGSFAYGEPITFQTCAAQGSAGNQDLPSPQAAAESWACWMRSQDCEVFELPRTARTREWGLTFSVTPKGEESRIFVISREH